jgi:hypothetical protein
VLDGLRRVGAERVAVLRGLREVVADVREPLGEPLRLGDGGRGRLAHAQGDDALLGLLRRERLAAVPRRDRANLPAVFHLRDALLHEPGEAVVCPLRLRAHAGPDVLLRSAEGSLRLPDPAALPLENLHRRAAAEDPGEHQEPDDPHAAPSPSGRSRSAAVAQG